MHPILFKLGPITIYSYGAMLALAFLVGIAVAYKRAPKLGIEPQLILDLSVYIIIGALIGSRVLYVISRWSDYRHDLPAIFKLWEGGLAFHGGLAGAVLISLWYLRKKKVSFWKVGDLIIPSVALGHALGRLGCFLNGCCYGISTGSPLGVTFPPGSFAASHFGCDHHIHPVQLYAAIALFIIFLILVKLTPRAGFEGEIFCLYGVVYGVLRFSLEFLRAEHPPFLFSLTLYQIISIGLIVFSLVMLGILWRRSGGIKTSSRKI